MTVTAPLDTSKSLLLKLAIPLLDVVASSPVIVNVFCDIEVSIPAPAVIVNVSVIPIDDEVEDSSAILNFISCAFIFFSVPLSDTKNLSVGTNVIPAPSVAPSMFKTVSTEPNSTAVQPEFTFNT